MTRSPGEPVVLPSAAGAPGPRLGLIPAGDDQAVVHIELSGVPVPYVERQRAFQKGVGGLPITYSYKTRPVRTYQQWLRDAAMRAMGDRPPLTGALVMTMTAFMPAPKSMRKADRLLAERELLPVTKAARHDQPAESDRGCVQTRGLGRRQPGQRPRAAAPLFAPATVGGRGVSWEDDDADHGDQG